MQFWIDGSFKEEQSIRIPLLSHSLHYGSAIFEGIRFYETERGPAIFRLNEHIERFFHSAEQFRLRLPYSVQELCNAALQTVRINALRSGYIRPIAFWGEGDMELHPTHACIHVGIAVWPWAPRLGQRPIRVMTSSFLRTPPSSTIISAKFTGHYANSILARQEARDQGFDEALLLDHAGHIAEGPGANFFAVRDGVLFSPPEGNIFPGITRASLIELAQKSDIPFQEHNLLPADIPLFDEAFFSGTAVEVAPIQVIDGVAIRSPHGNITTRLQKLYRDVVEGREKGMNNWLTWVLP